MKTGTTEREGEVKFTSEYNSSATSSVGFDRDYRKYTFSVYSSYVEDASLNAPTAVNVKKIVKKASYQCTQGNKTPGIETSLIVNTFTLGLIEMKEWDSRAGASS